VKYLISLLLALPLLASRSTSHSFQPDAEQPIQQFAAPYLVKAVGLVSSEHGHARVRCQTGAEEWSAWQEVMLGDENGTLAWFEGGCRAVEVQAAQPMKVALIDPGEGPIAPKTAELPRLAADRAPGQALAVPPMVSRSGWGCPPELCPFVGTPARAPVTHLIVHHSAGGNTAADWAAVVRSIRELHVNTNGWSDIGYNYLIDPNGILYEGRFGGMGVVGAHFSGVNTGTMGVCLIGTYSTRRPTEASLGALRYMLAWQSDMWRIDPLGRTMHASSGLMLDVISGHRDAGLSPRAAGTTECPGNGLYAELSALRVAAKRFADTCPVNMNVRSACFGAEGGPLPGVARATEGCSLFLMAEVTANWIQLAGPDSLRITPNSGERRSATVFISNQPLTITQAGASEAALPCVGHRGVVNSATFDMRPVTPGSIISVFGANFAAAGETTEVLINGRAFRPTFLSEQQLQVQLPTQQPTGVARLNVRRGDILGPDEMFAVTEAAPGLYAALNESGTLNTREQPAAPGQFVQIFLTGGGPVEGGFPGYAVPTPTAPLRPARLAWRALASGREMEAPFLGLAPILIGVWQANAKVSDDLSPGTYELQIESSGALSPALPLYVRGL
jgi:uncharacterized protein (TIGR03437 family)